MWGECIVFLAVGNWQDEILLCCSKQSWVTGILVNVPTTHPDDFKSKLVASIGVVVMG